MVALSVLVVDVVENVAYLSTAPLLWAFLYLFAWESPALAKASGFGRLAFWLLLPGSLLGTIANAPFLAIGPAVVAINIGGGVIPITLAALLLRRHLGDRPRAAILLGALFVVESAAALAWVLVLPSLGASAGALVVAGTSVPLLDAIGVTVAVTIPTVAILLAPGPSEVHRAVGLGLGITSLALLITYLTTAAAPGVGIVSTFPGYLLAPAVAGALAVALGSRVAGLRLPASLGVGYAAGTLGVLVGADALHQPPLYNPPIGAIYSIGGAGLLDLLYLSGLLALAAGYLTHRLLLLADVDTQFDPGSVPPEAPSVRTQIGGAMRQVLDGDYVGAARTSSTVASESRSVALSFAGVPPSMAAAAGWSAVGAPHWVDADQRNLEALAAQPRLAARDAWRAHLTSRYIARFGQGFVRRRFAAISRRTAAFGLDLTLLLVPGILTWYYVSATARGSVATILDGTMFNAVALGFTAYAFAYFVIGEGLYGTTVGKHVFRLRVRDRALRSPPALPVLVRDLPKLIPLTIIGIGGAAATVLAVRGSAITTSVTSASGLSVPASLLASATLIALVLLGVALTGAASAVAIATSGENQRLGDYLAGTWVIQE